MQEPEEGNVRNTFAGASSAPVIQARDIAQVEIHYSAPAERAVPRGLPLAPLRLVNRDRELAELDRLLEDAERSPGPVVAVLSGMRGVGKSATGSHWANRVRTKFDGGDLFADFSKRRDGAGVSVSDVLADFIRDLEAAEFAVPATLAERTRTFRRITASRRLLILLDDVAQAAEIKPLLPSGAGSVVLVTSNSHLEELVYDGAALVAVDPLDDDAALMLLIEMVGAERIAAELDASKQLLSICGGLPVALCVCGARLARHRDRSVSWLTEQMGDESRRLSELSGKGGSVQRVFDFAYADLDDEEAFFYRRLGLHPGLSLSPVAAAVLGGRPLAAAAQALDSLCDTHLLEAGRGDHYRFHDLVRVHARECARSEPEVEREAAVRRLVDWYYGALRLADRTLIADRLRLANDDDLACEHLPSLSSEAEVFAWFEDERSNIMRVLAAAAEREWDDRVWPMAEALWLLVFNRQLFSDWIESARAGIESAQRAGRVDAEARMRALLARAHLDLGEFEQARRELVLALRGARQSGNEWLIASVREFLGTLYTREGDYAGAISEFEVAREVFVALKRARGIAIQDYHLGAALTENGEPDKALAPLRCAVETMREIGDEINTGRALLYLGEAQKADGRDDEAEATLSECVAIMAPLGIRHTEGAAYEALGAIAEAREQTARALEYRKRAYEAYRSIGHPRASSLSGNPD